MQINPLAVHQALHSSVDELRRTKADREQLEVEVREVSPKLT